MAHGRQKQGFGFIGPVCKEPGTLQCHFNLFARADVAECANQHILTFVTCRRKGEVQEAAIFHLNFIAVARIILIESATNPAMTQLCALTAAA